MRQFRPIPPEFNLGETLARRVFQIREFRNMTRKDLSRYSRLKEEKIEDIEAGVETWLSVVERQLLAKALSIEPILLQEVETRPNLGAETMYALEIELGKKILEGKTVLECPKCGGTLNCRVEQGYDIQGNVIKMAKAYCTSCAYTLR
ncbi:MAG: hypothetical protein K2W95_31095 [Candidatus Obscuribacterales bacterium]|nr:hypothetical protein [Candidatus Obscuribacterales bacterium]